MNTEIEEELLQKKEQEIKYILFSKEPEDNNIGVIRFNNDFTLSKPASKKEFILSQKFGAPYPKKSENDNFLDLQDDNLTLEEVTLIAIEDNKRHKSSIMCMKSNDPKYDEPIIITFEVETPNNATQKINISVTSRELIEARLNPEIFKCLALEQSKQTESQISSTDIATATKSKISQRFLDTVGKVFNRIIGKEDDGR